MRVVDALPGIGRRSHAPVLRHRESESVLFLRSTGYDPVSRTMTVRYRSPSGTLWSAYEYREVPTDKYSRVLAARPHGQQVIKDEIAPFHARRRLGDHSWQPLPCTHEPLENALTT